MPPIKALVFPANHSQHEPTQDSTQKKNHRVVGCYWWCETQTQQVNKLKLAFVVARSYRAPLAAAFLLFFFLLLCR